ncbi:LLM class flavin-dependent oxidoreductase [Nonomuraea soli]|uniref:Alkanesulfonate monooxygenase SsuD/methylene tetrahydromethanopterin reductase-like flavin-dependent oxidoreductase (Luciferase family) n=1 Tax=Nonomuraea soli TaxID=1032476 RepID=A0A7W0CE33_9ACTN|nr:LLM class flavin-dependent oxidoreductase [Nonomuraea soli]MBA2889473.1 alkanesulfonate monooxygenase SsuD/methylene tetrahydromethanopterin reductase-like flavin-dependent oxidoreductase (luciferase family) [Nonomuraea soli]
MSLHLAVALEGAGWHPAAWREGLLTPSEVFDAQYWTALVREAERGLLDFVTFEDSFGLQSTLLDGLDSRTDQVRGRLDAVLLAARIAPLTTHIGLVPTATTTHTEPFHVAIGIASLDFASEGRAGWQPRISARSSEAALIGRRDFPILGTGTRAQAHEGRPTAFEAAMDDDFRRHVAGLFEEAGDAVEVARRLWDSWEDDAEIRDEATGRFLDRDKLHTIDFEGRFFSVRGPSITPRSPQGQPVVTALAHSRVPYEFAVRHADVVFVTPHSREEAAATVAELRDLEAGSSRGPVKIFADLLVFLGDDAAERKARLDALDGAPLASDALVFAGSAEELADLLLDWREAGVEGFRLRPGALPYDLKVIARELTAVLRARGAFRDAYEAGTLRGHLGLTRPASRYAEVS